MIELDETTKNRVAKAMPMLAENQRRKFLGIEALALGHGGIEALSKLTGAARSTISLGMKEASEAESDPKARTSSAGMGRIRSEGAGRKTIEETNPGVTKALEALVSETTIGNPENPLCWTTKSLRNLEAELVSQGHKISYVKVGELLEGLGYSLQLNKKALQVGEAHVDRDAQFEHINTKARSFMKEGLPVISVDTKKKENIGNFKNNGVEYAPKGDPTQVLDHDFPLLGLGKASPYGIYDVRENEGYVNVGISSDTAMFTAQSIRSWWDEMGCLKYHGATKLYITADGGGSNGSRNKLWKKSLQLLSNEIGLEIHVSHFPPGTSKWNKIEHRMFSHISKNWRGRPLVSLAVIISLIGSTTTQKGLRVKCGLDTNEYEKGIKVSDRELEELNISRHEFHGEWNYWVSPSETFA
ncbi:ISAzo13 family transposase [Sphaerochaeta sp. PS]|uniref:ISAzo13 family transposase n=1 Tax=Sphaerochaeta sp. PS TaxID=3076336 RepID=UPI0028A43563|nr:ISAzo13 family transposase [Sphaerochaeta sp. PS]MDT4761061.1 ISAzo13 family transposase [Sphaerochaeta sp. PS]